MLVFIFFFAKFFSQNKKNQEAKKYPLKIAFSKISIFPVTDIFGHADPKKKKSPFLSLSR